MIVCCAAFLSAAGLQAAAPTWIKARSGPFETVSDDGRRAAAQALSQFEQFRFALGMVLGKPDLQFDPPIRIILSRSAADTTSPEVSESCRGVHPGRDRLTVCAPAEAQLPAELLRSLTRILLENNFTAMPRSMELAVENFFSTIQSNATHVTWGAPPAPAERTRDWALLHRIVTQPDYAGKARIYLHNLASGMDRRSAVKNAFGEDGAKFEADTDRYYEAGIFQTSPAPSRPINPDHDFAITPLTSDEGILMRADLLDSSSAGLYRQLLAMGKHASEANEGLGLLAVHGNDAAQARKFFEAAIASGSKNVVMMTAFAGLQQDPGKAVKILQDAVAIDPKYAPARWMLGEKSDDPRMRLMQWKRATALAPRNADWWSRYAQFCVDQKQFAEAGRAWVAAAQAAPDDAHRNAYLNNRGQIDEQRLHAEDEERRKQIEAQTRELDQLKAEARKENRGHGSSSEWRSRAFEECGRGLVRYQRCGR